MPSVEVLWRVCCTSNLEAIFLLGKSNTCNKYE